MTGAEVYEVFARYEPSESLRHVGSVRAADEREAGLFAYTLYDEWRWLNLIVAPARAVTYLMRPEGGSKAEGGGPALKAGDYLLFARSDYTAPLQQRGRVTLPEGTDAQGALGHVGGGAAADWIECAIVAEAAVHTVIDREKPARAVSVGEA